MAAGVNELISRCLLGLEDWGFHLRFNEFQQLARLRLQTTPKSTGALLHMCTGVQYFIFLKKNAKVVQTLVSSAALDKTDCHQLY